MNLNKSLNEILVELNDNGYDEIVITMKKLPTEVPSLSALFGDNWECEIERKKLDRETI